MPSKTKKQAKFMRAVAHGFEPDRIKGPSKKVAKEFAAVDKRKKKKRKKVRHRGKEFEFL